VSPGNIVKFPSAVGTHGPDDFADRRTAGPSRRAAASPAARRAAGTCATHAAACGRASNRPGAPMPRSTSCWCAKSGSPGSPNWRSARVVDGGDPQVRITRAWSSELAVARATLQAKPRRQLSEIERRRRVYLATSRRRRFPAGRSLSSMTDRHRQHRARALPRRQKRPEPEGSSAPSGCPRGHNRAAESGGGRHCCLSSPEHSLLSERIYRQFRSSADADVIALLGDRRNSASQRAIL